MTASNRVSELDVGHIRDDRFVIRLKLRTIPARAEQTGTAEEPEEDTLELPAEDHVDDEVYTTVYRDSQVARLYEPVRSFVIKFFVNVRY